MPMVECRNCNHYRPHNRGEVDADNIQLGDCTRYPEWVPVKPFHRCGEHVWRCPSDKYEDD